MPYQVLLTDDAARDLEELYAYIVRNDAPDRADYVLGKIEKALAGLSEMPRRGAHPPGAAGLGHQAVPRNFL